MEPDASHICNLDMEPDAPYICNLDMESDAPCTLRAVIARSLPSTCGRRHAGDLTGAADAFARIDELSGGRDFAALCSLASVCTTQVRARRASPDLTSPHLTSPDLASPHPASPRLTVPHRQGRHADACDALERALTIGAPPSPSMAAETLSAQVASSHHTMPSYHAIVSEGWLGSSRLISAHLAPTALPHCKMIGCLVLPDHAPAASPVCPRLACSTTMGWPC